MLHAPTGNVILSHGNVRDDIVATMLTERVQNLFFFVINILLIQKAVQMTMDDILTYDVYLLHGT